MVRHVAPAVLAAFLFAAAGPVQSAPGDPSLLELQSEAARTGGKIRVIVEFAAPPAASALGPDAPESVERAATAALRAVQADILAADLGFDRSVTLAGSSTATLMDYVPMLAVEADPQALARLAADPRVTRILPDLPEKPHLSDTVPMIGMTGAGGAYARGADGRGRAIAVIDTGVAKGHEFLKGKVIAEACYGTRSTYPHRVPLCPGGARSSTASGSGLDCTVALPGCGHGTFVAGIAAGRNTSRQSGEPANGVARAAAIVAIKVFTRVDDVGECDGPAPCIVSYRSDQVKALERVYALRGGVANRKIDVANVSLGTGPVYKGYCDGDPRASIIAKLKAAGIATVVSSGNAGATNGVAAPACIRSAITVGATTKRSGSRAERIAAYSNEGPQVDLLAPGGQPGWPFGTTRDLVQSAFPGGGYLRLSGTSLAAPHVSGAIAAIRSRAACRSKSLDEITTALKSTGPMIEDDRPGGSVDRRRLSVVAAMKKLGCA